MAEERAEPGVIFPYPVPAPAPPPLPKEPDWVAALLSSSRGRVVVGADDASCSDVQDDSSDLSSELSSELSSVISSMISSDEQDISPGSDVHSESSSCASSVRSSEERNYVQAGGSESSGRAPAAVRSEFEPSSSRQMPHYSATKLTSSSSGSIGLERVAPYAVADSVSGESGITALLAGLSVGEVDAKSDASSSCSNQSGRGNLPARKGKGKGKGKGRGKGKGFGKGMGKGRKAKVKKPPRFTAPWTVDLVERQERLDRIQEEAEQYVRELEIKQRPFDEKRWKSLCQPVLTTDQQEKFDLVLEKHEMRVISEGDNYPEGAIWCDKCDFLVSRYTEHGRGIVFAHIHSDYHKYKLYNGARPLFADWNRRGVYPPFMHPHPTRKGYVCCGVCEDDVWGSVEDVEWHFQNKDHQKYWFRQCYVGCLPPYIYYDETGLNGNHFYCEVCPDFTSPTFATAFDHVATSDHQKGVKYATNEWSSSRIDEGHRCRGCQQPFETRDQALEHVCMPCYLDFENSPYCRPLTMPPSKLASRSEEQK